MSLDYLTRYEQLLQRQGINYLRLGDLILREYGSIIIPMGPVIQTKPEKPIDKNEIFSKLKGKLVWWSYHRVGFEENDWYAVIKDKYNPIEAYRTANIRNQIRKGLKTCQIKKITASELMERGFTIYQKAFNAFNQQPPMNESAYKKWLQSFNGFDDIIHFIGIFYNEVLIGYALIYLYGEQEANVSEIRIDPINNKFYPSYALFHWVSEEYLERRQMEYISDGYRNLLHQTRIQELLIQKFGFRKVGLYLAVEIRPPWARLFTKSLIKVWHSVPISSFKAVATLTAIKYKQEKRLPK